LAACTASTTTPPAIGVGGIWNIQDHQAPGDGAGSSGTAGARGGRSAASGGMGRGT
jgi:hypothetical protein